MRPSIEAIIARYIDTFGSIDAAREMAAEIEKQVRLDVQAERNARMAEALANRPIE